MSFIQITKSQIQSMNNDGDDDDDDGQESDNDSIRMGFKRKRMLLTPTPTMETRTILDAQLNELSLSKENLKKKKTTTIEEALTLERSFSVLSISQENIKKATVTSKESLAVDNQIKNGNEESSMSYLEKFKPRYLKVSDHVFKRILSNSIENGFKLVQCLNTPEKIRLVRDMTELTNDLCFKDYQEKLWQEYSNISAKDNNWWESKITKQFGSQNATCRMYKPSKSYIEERQATISKQKQRIGNQFKECLSKLLNQIERWQPSIDGTLLSHAINECVRNSQRRLNEEFQYKKEMLTFDWNDHQLLQQFYALKPNNELIQLAQEIWQVTANEIKTKEQEEILQQRIYLKRLPTKIDQTINSLVEDNEVTLSNPFFEADQRASFASRCSKIMIQFKFTLMMTELDEFAILKDRYDRTLTNLKEKLGNLHKTNPHLYTTSLIDLIEERRQAMIQRTNRIRQHKLRTFFDQAPTVVNNNDNN